MTQSMWNQLVLGLLLVISPLPADADTSAPGGKSKSHGKAPSGALPPAEANGLRLTLEVERQRVRARLTNVGHGSVRVHLGNTCQGPLTFLLVVDEREQPMSFWTGGECVVANPVSRNLAPGESYAAEAQPMKSWAPNAGPWKVRAIYRPGPHHGRSRLYWDGELSTPTQTVANDLH